MKKFIEVGDVTDIQALINKGLAYKQHPLMDKALGANKRVGLLFLNPSLRTRPKKLSISLLNTRVCLL